MRVILCCTATCGVGSNAGATAAAAPAPVGNALLVDVSSTHNPHFGQNCESSGSFVPHLRQNISAQYSVTGRGRTIDSDAGASTFVTQGTGRVAQPIRIDPNLRGCPSIRVKAVSRTKVS